MTLYAFFSFVALLLYLQAAIYVWKAMPPDNVHRSFVFLSLSLAWMSLCYLLFSFFDQSGVVYLLDRMAVIARYLFPVLLVWFFMHFTQNQSAWWKRFVFFGMLPLAAGLILTYLWEASSLKQFYRGEDSLWYFNPAGYAWWFHLSALYFAGGAFTCLWLLYSRANNRRPSFSNKEKLQRLIMGVSLMLLMGTAMITELTPLLAWGVFVPETGHLTTLPLMAGLFFPLTLLNPRRFFRDELADQFIRRIRQFVFYLDRTGQIYAMNRFAQDVLQYPRHQLVYKNAEDLFFRPPIVRKQLDRARGNLDTKVVACSLISAEGNLIPVRVSIIRVHDTFRNIVGFVLLGVDNRQKLELHIEVRKRNRVRAALDELRAGLEKRVERRREELIEANKKLDDEIARRERIEEQLRKELSVKDEMLREIHHRVKNNVQMIVSLVNMAYSQKRLPDHEHEKFGKIVKRVREISQIHENLYDSPYIGKIKFGNFIRATASELKGRFIRRKDVYFRVKHGKEEISIDLAIPCGIIVYELLTNALIHAFPEEKTRDLPVFAYSFVNIEFYKEEEEYHLVVWDNGRGLPLTDGMPAETGIGLNLVHALVSDYLNGSISYSTHKGTRVIVRFTDNHLS